MTEVENADALRAITLRGNLGWGLRKGGLEAYGPEGRWGGQGRYADHGDLLGDALERAGATEGANFVVVAVPRFGDESILDVIERVVADDRTTVGDDV